MAIAFYDAGNDDGDNDPLIRELDLDDLVTKCHQSFLSLLTLLLSPNR